MICCEQCSSNNMVFFICIVHHAMLFLTIFEPQPKNLRILSFLHMCSQNKRSFLDSQDHQDKHCIKNNIFLNGLLPQPSRNQICVCQEKPNLLQQMRPHHQFEKVEKFTYGLLPTMLCPSAPIIHFKQDRLPTTITQIYRSVKGQKNNESKWSEKLKNEHKGKNEWQENQTCKRSMERDLVSTYMKSMEKNKSEREPLEERTNQARDKRDKIPPLESKEMKERVKGVSDARF